MANLKISVITPSFNSGNVIKCAIESVRSQNYTNVEHIIIDGGSTDTTQSILKNYSEIKWISESDKGQSDAMNKGFKLASGDIIVYLNADDYFLPNAFCKIIPYFEAGYDFVMGNVLLVTSCSHKWLNTPKTTFRSMLRHWEDNAFCINPVGYFYKKEIQDKIPFNCSNHLSMDLEFLLNVSLKYKIKKIEETFGVFNYSEDCKTGNSQSNYNFWKPSNWPFIEKMAFENLSSSELKRFLKDRDQGYKIRNQRNLRENNTSKKWEGIIYDIGMNNGQDTDYYLKKGFKVIAIEANPNLANEVKQKYLNYISTNQLTILNIGIASQKDTGKKLKFYYNVNLTEWGSFDKTLGWRNIDQWFSKEQNVRGRKCIEVDCKTLAEVIKIYGTPYYVKIDIEGYDNIALNSMLDEGFRPKYISVENGGEELINLLYNAGYNHFKYIPMHNVESQILYNDCQEGKSINYKFKYGSSGAFGEDTPGAWIGYKEIKEKSQYSSSKKAHSKGHWFDVHAKIETPKEQIKKKDSVNKSKLQNASNEILYLKKKIKEKNKRIVYLEKNIELYKNSISFKTLNPIHNFIRKTYYKNTIRRLIHFINELNDLKTIKGSNLFNESYYIKTNPEIDFKSISPHKHYLKYGGFNGKNPSESFCSAEYLNYYDDVKAAKTNPLTHYIKFGKNENRKKFKVINQINYSLTSKSKLDWLTFDKFQSATISRESHFKQLSEIYDFKKIFNKIPRNEGDKLKQYTDLLLYAYIKKNVPKGSKILEIGGGFSRVLSSLSIEYECWNIDKFEGIGNGPIKIPSEYGYKNIVDYIGNFNSNLPSNKFDFIFSISVFEHLPLNDEELYASIYKDIDRLLKKGGSSLHTIDVVTHDFSKIELHPIINYLEKNVPNITKHSELSEINKNNDLYYINEDKYNRNWKHLCNNIPYIKFGTPFSINLLWTK